jgi:hypothetical protein
MRVGRKHKKKPSLKASGIDKTIEQIISVQVSGGRNGTLFSDGITTLNDAFFDSVGPISADRTNHISGIAPNNGVDRFVVLEYISKSVMLNNSIEIHLINHDCKVLIDTGRIMIGVNEINNTKSYSIIGGEIGSWEIITKQASSEVLAKSILFNNEDTAYRNSVRSVELVDLKDDKEGARLTYVEPLIRMFDNNPLFAQFVKEHCNGDISVTSVSAGLSKYLIAEGIKANRFTRRMREGNSVLFYNLAALKNLHPDLRPLLNTHRDIAKETGAERIIISTGAMIARFPLERQIGVWNQVKSISSQPLMSATITKIKRG